MAEHNSAAASRQRLRLSSGTELSFITAGEASQPAVRLLHGTPNSARMFREVAPSLVQSAYVIAPDLPGHGESDVLPAVSFHSIGQAISELLDGTRMDRDTALLFAPDPGDCSRASMKPSSWSWPTLRRVR